MGLASDRAGVTHRNRSGAGIATGIAKDVSRPQPDARVESGMAVVSLISSMTKEADTSASFTLAISRWYSLS
jgi:hypothetical protein